MRERGKEKDSGFKGATGLRRYESALYPVNGAVLTILADLREKWPQKTQKRFVIYVPFVANLLKLVHPEGLEPPRLSA